VVFCLLALTARASIYMVAILSAMGHGSLTRREAIPLYIIGGVVALVGGSVAALVCERWALHATRERTPEQRAVTRFTRPVTFAICVALVVIVPPLAREARFRSMAARVSSRAYSAGSRQTAIADLALYPSPRSFELLRRVASNEQDVPSVRRAAILGLWHYPEAIPVLVALARSPDMEVRATAGVVLLSAFSSDQTAWAAVEQLARDDSPVIRTQMIGLLRTSSDPRASGLVEELAGPEAPRLNPYDGLLAVVMDVNASDEGRLAAIHTLAGLKDERALAVFRTIVMGLDPGFARPERETKFRDAARVAGTYITGNQQPDWMSAFDNEQSALFDAENMMRTQLHRRKMLGVFDPCPVPGAVCVPGHERDALHVTPARRVRRALSCRPASIARRHRREEAAADERELIRVGGRAGDAIQDRHSWFLRGRHGQNLLHPRWTDAEPGERPVPGFGAGSRSGSGYDRAWRMRDLQMSGRLPAVAGSAQ
jgi:hypothetical protein